MPGKERIDWETVREEYVTGDDSVTHTTLAVRHHTRRETVAKRAGREGWATQRSQYRHQVATKTRERTSTWEAERKAVQLRTAQEMRELALAELERLRTPRIVKVRGEDGVERDVELPRLIEEQMDAREVRLWLKDAASIENAALGIEGEVNIRLEAELTEMLRRLQTVLSSDDYLRALDVLSVPDETEN